MSDLAHRTSSWPWQMRQAAQRFGEWVEYQLSRIEVDGPEVTHWTWLEPFARGVFWLMVAGLALGLAWWLYQGLRAYLNRPRNPSLSVTQTPGQAPLRPAAHWWREAQRLAQQGDYAAACTALYLAELARLHETDILPYCPSRTDGEYLAHLAATAHRPYELLIRTHERLTFGQATATEETYQRCRRAYQEITQP